MSKNRSVIYPRVFMQSTCNFNSMFLMEYLSLIFHPIDFKPWNNDPYVMKLYAMTFFLKNSQLFFRMFAGYSGLLCGSMSVQ